MEIVITLAMQSMLDCHVIVIVVSVPRIHVRSSAFPWFLTGNICIVSMDAQSNHFWQGMRGNIVDGKYTIIVESPLERRNPRATGSSFPHQLSRRMQCSLQL